MRVTNAMLMNQALSDLDILRRKYASAQAAVNGKVLERPSEDPQRVVEAMDLSGAKLRMERAKRTGEDAREWLQASEASLSNMVDRLQAAMEVAVEVGGAGGFGADSREGFALTVESIRDALLREMNNTHRDQHLFAGWATDVTPFVLDADGGANYVAGNSGTIKRDIAPGLSVEINIPGDELLAKGDFIRTLSDMADDLRAGRIGAVANQRLDELTKEFDQINMLRSGLGVRVAHVEQYQTFAAEGLEMLEGRLTELTGANLEESVLRMTEAQTAYEAALASFAKALPSSLLDYMMR
ncbi:MAG TPA: hypothetical protein VD969_17110 [Symbiobacteriaceae bacterium]|nr:hypothetical protein [Symbiobacteriaceae bacterium]